MQPPASFTVPMLERVEDDAAFASLAPEWDDLLFDTAAPSVFATWAWLSTWRDTLGSGHRLAVVTARDPRDGLLLGAAPFAVEACHSSRRPPYRALVFLGSGPAAPDHLDLLVRRGHEDVVGAALVARRSADGRGPLRPRRRP